jgi:hypothetical protein
VHKTLTSAAALVATLVCLGAAACGNTRSGETVVSPSLVVTSGLATSARESQPAGGGFCPALAPGHPLVLAEIGGSSPVVVVRDVVDPNHGRTLCTLPPGAPRFVSATKVALWSPGDIWILDLVSGSSTQLLSYVHNDGPVVTLDWSTSGELFAYGRETSDGQSIVFHLLDAGVDRVLATVTGKPIGVGAARIEFSPDDQYVAFGVAGSVSTGDGAAVQVRRPDGTLVFSSGGTSQLTWAGEAPKLYFQGTSAVETWDPAHGPQTTPVSSWLFPIRSPGGRWLAYGAPAAYPGKTEVMDTRDGTQRSIPTAQEVAWVTSSLIRYTDFVSCQTPGPGEGGPPKCITQEVIYDMSDGTKSATGLGHVFGTWPKSSPSWT